MRGGDCRGRPGPRARARERRVEPRAGLRAPSRRPAGRGAGADPAGARNRSFLHRGDATLALARSAIGHTTTPLASAAGAGANPRDRDAVLQLSLLHITRAEFAEALAASWRPSEGDAAGRAPSTAEVGAAWPEAPRGGAPRAEACPAPCRRRSPGVTNLGSVLVDLGRAARRARCMNRRCAARAGIRACWPTTASVSPRWAIARRPAKRWTPPSLPIPTTKRCWPARVSTHDGGRPTRLVGSPAHRRGSARAGGRDPGRSPWSRSPRPTAPIGCASSRLGSGSSARIAFQEAGRNCRREGGVSRPRIASDRPVADQQGARGGGAVRRHPVGRPRAAGDDACERDGARRPPSRLLRAGPTTGEEPQKAA